jgi:hypothetical protein
MGVRLLCSFFYCVGSGVCDGLITHPEESYRVCVCDPVTSQRHGLFPIGAVASQKYVCNLDPRRWDPIGCPATSVRNYHCPLRDSGYRHKSMLGWGPAVGGTALDPIRCEVVRGNALLPWTVRVPVRQTRDVHSHMVCIACTTVGHSKFTYTNAAASLRNVTHTLNCSHTHTHTHKAACKLAVRNRQCGGLALR